MILTTERARYLENHDWVSLFGEVEQCRNETWGDLETLRVSYRPGFEIEYNFSAPSWAGVPVDPGTQRVVTDGMKILFDSKGKFEALQNRIVNY